MPGPFDRLAVRIAAAFLAGLIALQLAISLIIVWPEGRPGSSLLAALQEAADVARALEAASPTQQAMIVAALNRGRTIVQLEPDFPASDSVDGSVRNAPRLEQLFAQHAGALEGRPFRVQARDGVWLRSLMNGRVGAEGPVRLLVRLHTGQALVVEHAPVVLQRFLGRLLQVAAAAAVILLVVLLVCMQQIARPIRDLAESSRRFALDITAPDLPVRGPRELKELSAAFNDMKHTIRGLIDERTRVLAAIAHDLRTYLTRLRLRADFIDDAEQRTWAVNDLQEMGHLLDDTLMFAREATAIPAPRREQIDVCAALAEFAAVRREVGEPVQDLAPTEEALLCYCAPLALRRMLTNLTDNAVRYGGGARLCARREDDHIAIVVDDDGPGVPPEALDRLTAPFERLERSRGRETGGAGLGLAIVKALAQSQGGSLSIENRRDGGLRAQIRLRAVAARLPIGHAA